MPTTRVTGYEIFNMQLMSTGNLRLLTDSNKTLLLSLSLWQLLFCNCHELGSAHCFPGMAGSMLHSQLLMRNYWILYYLNVWWGLWSEVDPPNIDPVHMATVLAKGDCLHCIALHCAYRLLWQIAILNSTKMAQKQLTFVNCLLFSCTDLPAASISGSVNSIGLGSMSWIRCP
jgi:hypothetical protein